MRKGCVGMAFLLLIFLAVIAVKTYPAGIGSVAVEAQEISGVTSDAAQNGDGATAIRDLTDAFDVILKGADKDFIAGYQVDSNFLMWLDAEYGDDAVLRLACYVKDGNASVDYWRTLTGSSIHVLWLEYCRESGFGRYMLDNVYWMDTASTDETVISFTGDFNLADNWETMKYLSEQPNGIYDCISGDLLSVMNDSDITIMNNEFCYSDRGRAIAGKDYTFRAAMENVSLLEAFGVDGVSLANNHVYDYGADALEDTFEALDGEGIPYVGAGSDLDDASRILYYVANGQKIAILSATEIERSTKYTREASENESGVLKTLDPEYFVSLIEKAKADSDYVIVFVHWGTEGTLFPDQSQKSLAQQYAEAGADAVIGSHPHRLQGAWYVDGVPVAYSLGNFWFSDATLYTTLAQVVITDDGLSLRYLPCVQEGLTTRLLTEDDEKEEFYQYLAAISGNIGIDEAGNVYDKKSEDYSENIIAYDSDTASTPIRALYDNDGYVIDIVGNRR